MEYPRSGILSPTEVEVIGWAEKGQTNKEIAGNLGIATGTVKSHLRNIFIKLRAANRTEAVERWRQIETERERPIIKDYYPDKTKGEELQPDVFSS